MNDEIVEENLCGVTIRRRVLPYRIKDPSGVFTDTAKWMVEFERKVGIPVAAAMLERMDQMWGNDATGHQDGKRPMNRPDRITKLSKSDSFHV